MYCNYMYMCVCICWNNRGKKLVLEINSSTKATRLNGLLESIMCEY